MYPKRGPSKDTKSFGFFDDLFVTTKKIILAIAKYPYKIITNSTRTSCKMAWQCSGNSNDSLIDNLIGADIIRSNSVEMAMRKTDRADYAPNDVYADRPQRIGYDVTISAPHMHAHALEELADQLQPGARVLDVGSGSGYLTAVSNQKVHLSKLRRYLCSNPVVLYFFIF